MSIVSINIDKYSFKSYSKKKRSLFGAYSIIIIKHNLKTVYNFIFFYIIV